MKKYLLYFLVLSGTLHSRAQSTYNDVAGIFYAKCTSCHHAGGGAPFSLMTYSQTTPWASAIKHDLNTGKMPPWSPDTSYTRFVHERIITSSEKNAIIKWIDQGTVKGDTALAPVPPAYASKYKLKGQPDLIIKVPAFASNGNTRDAYNCFSLPTGLTHDRVIRAFEIVPNNLSIVHHVVVKVDTTGSIVSNTTGDCFNQPGQLNLDGYAPGSPPIVFPGKAPLKMGIRLKQGSNIIMQVHYPAGSAGKIDSTEMRIYFYPLNETGIRQVRVGTPLQNWALAMPPNTTPSFTAQFAILWPVSVFGAFPHSHLICNAIHDYAYKGSDTIPLIKINNWDFNWQGFYTFRRMVKIPAGYILTGFHQYNNTSSNPNNPNSPPQLILAGEGTKDEMLFDSFQWLEYQPGDELIDIEKLLSNDSLLAISTPEIISKTAAPKTFIFPNPAENNAFIYAEGFDFATHQPILKMYNSLGAHVYSKLLFSAKESLTFTHLESGIYFYTVSDGKHFSNGKFVVSRQ